MYISSEKESSAYLEVNSCAKQTISARDRAMLRPHGRVDYHILYILCGMCYITEGGEEQAVSAGNLILYRPHERQEYRFRAADASVSAYIHFSGTACAELLARVGLLARRVTFVGCGAVLDRIFAEMAEEHMAARPYHRESAAALLWQFLAAAGRQAARYAAGELPQQERIDAVCHDMYEHYREERSVADYAALCHLSEGRFAHLFRACTGTSPRQYLIGIRMSVARRLLADTDLSVGEIAEAVGIPDVNYFSRLYKKHTGQAPSKQR